MIAMILRCFLAWVGVVVAINVFGAAPSRCADPDLPKPINPGACRIESILFKHKEVIGSAELIVIVAEMTRYGDTFRTRVESFLRLQTGETIPLGSFPQAAPYNANKNIFTMLELRTANLRLVGHDGQMLDGSLFYDRIVDLDSEDRCVLFRLKSPFMGELKDCKGTYNSMGGTAAYSPGVTSVVSAIRAACSRLEAETSDRCENNGFASMGVRIQRQLDSSLYYLVTLRKQLPDMSELKMSQFGIPAYPHEYDYRVYRVDALGGNSTFVSQSRQDPTPR